MKKMTTIVIAAIFAISCSAYANPKPDGLGIGGAVPLGFGLYSENKWAVSPPYGGAELTFCPRKVPLFLGVGAFVGWEAIGVLVTADWWLLRTKLGANGNLYFGPGLFAYFPFGFAFGVRTPVGVELFPWKSLELYAELAPQFGIAWFYERSPILSIAGALGVRWWRH